MNTLELRKGGAKKIRLDILLVSSIVVNGVRSRGKTASNEFHVNQNSATTGGYNEYLRG